MWRRCFTASARGSMQVPSCCSPCAAWITRELVAKAGEGLPLAKKPASSKRVMAGGDLGAIFGVEMAETGGRADAPAPKASAKKGQKKPAARAKVPAKAATGRSSGGARTEEEHEGQVSQEPAALSCSGSQISATNRNGSKKGCIERHAKDRCPEPGHKDAGEAGGGGEHTDKTYRNTGQNFAIRRCA